MGHTVFVSMLKLECIIGQRYVQPAHKIALDKWRRKAKSPKVLCSSELLKISCSTFFSIFFSFPNPFPRMTFNFKLWKRCYVLASLSVQPLFISYSLLFFLKSSYIFQTAVLIPSSLGRILLYCIWLHLFLLN